MLEPPKNVEIRHHYTNLWWIEDDGIICSVSKKDHPDVGAEQYIEQLDDLRRVTGNAKKCMLLDITHAKPTSKEDREFASIELAKVIKALAFLSDSSLGKMIMNIFLHLKPPPYPAKMFTDEHEARVWLRQYL